MVAGISGATPGSGAGSVFVDIDGRLKLLHAPRNSVSAEAVASLTTVCALSIPIIPHSPRISRLQRPAAKRKTLAGAMTSAKETQPLRFGFVCSILYWPHQGGNAPKLWL
jgi:hypothetical protein